MTHKDNIIIRKAMPEDIDTIKKMIMGLAEYEKRPQDMTATIEELRYQLFERNIATVLLMERDEEVIGYAIYYPIFASFAARAKVHLEDFYIKEQFRGNGLGRRFFAKISEMIISEGYTGMEWSCLDWNTPSIGFYNKIGAKRETGREYFEYDEAALKNIADTIKDSKML